MPVERALARACCGRSRPACWPPRQRRRSLRPSAWRPARPATAPSGNSPSPAIPSIAGQPRVFIENQLVIMREGLREVPAGVRKGHGQCQGGTLAVSIRPLHEPSTGLHAFETRSTTLQTCGQADVFDCPPKRRPSRSLGRALPRGDLGPVADRGTPSHTDPASCGHRVCSAFIGGSGRPEVQPSWRRSRYLPCVLSGTSVCRADSDPSGSETRSRP
jgi:hypothetical protein